jgi:hypothetical protein
MKNDQNMNEKDIKSQNRSSTQNQYKYYKQCNKP